MIAYLQGEILEKTEKSLILNTGNIGYLVTVSPRVSESLEPKQNISLFIYTKVREDDISLFGFTAREELEFFKKLIEIQGIGPKSAMEILSMPMQKLKSAILSEDAPLLTQIPGIGKKSAERIILEMKNKIDPDELLGSTKEKGTINEEKHKDVLQALIQLGFERHNIIRGLKDIPETVKTPEETITYFLQHQ